MKISCLFFSVLASLPATLHAQVFEVRPPEVTVGAETLVILSCLEMDEVPAEYRQSPYTVAPHAMHPADSGLFLATGAKTAIVLTSEECLYNAKEAFSSLGDPTTLLITQK
ncbi:hypothetical protein FQV27_08140 [Paracoccus aurantiacus]|uniref:Uncharacterized protein n=1 Tax=Paracoccus aurantiacus TaxID=2599412 RepID=A0A5C6S8Z1_9RHOB|nr:hypothetical protein [Paracoccus aurantiacus]TXB70054.1 hypothetical protein FQV27_08140 [Paracoccus aurantiacus]